MPKEIINLENGIIFSKDDIIEPLYQWYYIIITHPTGVECQTKYYDKEERDTDFNQIGVKLQEKYLILLK
jgi:hypothetical protein